MRPHNDAICTCPRIQTAKGEVMAYFSMCPNETHRSLAFAGLNPPEMTPERKRKLRGFTARKLAEKRWGVKPVVHLGEGEASCQDS